MKDKFYVIGNGEFRNDRDDVYYIDCKSEQNLVDVFLKTWRKLDPDIVTANVALMCLILSIVYEECLVIIK